LDAGADHVIAGPISPQQVMDRIEAMVHRRKSFVVTAEYFGPDRRLMARPDGSARMVEVPNSLRDKALGNFDPKVLHNAIRATSSEADGHHIERKANALADTIDITLKADPEAIPEEQLVKLIRLAKSLAKRARASSAPGITELCDSARLVAERLQTGAQAEEHEAELLEQIAKALRAAVRTEENAAMAHEIATTIEKSHHDKPDKIEAAEPAKIRRAG
jgi:DNA-binding response OmpR family regulator